MSESSAAVSRKHAGCGHLCLTCGAQAAHEWMKGPALWNLLSSYPVIVLLTLALSALAAAVWVKSTYEPPPDVQQLLWSEAPPTLQYVHTVARSYYAFTLTADENGRASVPEVPGLMCFASLVEGSAYMVTTGQRMNVVGAKPGSVIHVGCW